MNVEHQTNYRVYWSLKSVCATLDETAYKSPSLYYEVRGSEKLVLDLADTIYFNIEDAIDSYEY